MPSSVPGTSESKVELDLNEIVINTVTTKKECAQLLHQSGILNLVAGILRDIYERKESEWPEDGPHFLLTQILQHIPIVKQMRLMNKNMEKRMVALTKELEKKEAKKIHVLKEARRKRILALQQLQLENTYSRHHSKVKEMLIPREQNSSVADADANADADDAEADDANADAVDANTDTKDAEADADGADA